MPSFFLALIAAAAATFGGKEALRVARLSAVLGRAVGLITACWVAALISCAVAAWLGAGIAEQLAPEAKGILVAIVLALAALELVVLGRGRMPKEPTRSFGAILIVLTVAQLTAAAGFLVFALAAATGVPALSAAGGTVGAGVALSIAWSAGERWERDLPLRLIALVCATAFALAALVTFLNSRGLIG